MKLSLPLKIGGKTSLGARPNDYFAL